MFICNEKDKTLNQRFKEVLPLTSQIDMLVGVKTFERIEKRRDWFYRN